MPLVCYLIKLLNLLLLLFSQKNVCVWSVTLSCPTLCRPWTVALVAPQASQFGEVEGKNTGVVRHFLLQGTSLTQGPNSHLLHLLHDWKSWLKTQHLKTKQNKTMAYSSITSWQIEGKCEEVTKFIFWAPKSLQTVTAAMKLKDAYSLEGKLWPTWKAC